MAEPAGRGAAVPARRDKTILCVYDGDWPVNATRIAKESRSFARAGYRVHMISRNDLAQPRLEQTPWMTVHRMPSVRPTWLNRSINLPFFFNPVWFFAILQAARRCNADLIFVRDLPLALTAVWVGQLLRLPVVYDMAEVYPVFMRDRFEFGRTAWSDYVLKNPRAAEVVERLVLARVHRTLVVSEESRLRCRALGVPSERLVMVGNTPEDMETLAVPQPVPPCYAPYAESFKLLFVGILLWDRGVAETVRAMPAILEKHPKTVLFIVGNGTERSRIERAIEEEGVGAHVFLLGHQDHRTLPPLYAHADIGLIPFLSGHHIKITLANKLFDYMAAGLPIVASDLPSMRRILDETRAGELFAPGDPAALARAVVGLLGDSARRRQLSENGRQAAVTKYHWAEDERRLLAAVGDEIGSAHPAA